MVFGAIEAGGTKMVCALVTDQGKILKRIEIPTTLPGETTQKMIDFFEDSKIVALGIGCFGPLDLRIGLETYGSITYTPKKGWTGYPIRQIIETALSIPVGIDTDVNAAILAEVALGAAKGCENAIYITIGTGIGVGVYCNGGLVHGLVHPEAGHILLIRDPEDYFTGSCPFHANCFEGLASGPAIEKRWGAPAKELSNRKEVWEIEAGYIAQAICDYIFMYSPERIILGGGVMHQLQLFGQIREKVLQLLGGYVRHKQVISEIDRYIVAPELGDDSGILGAALLGRLAFEKDRK